MFIKKKQLENILTVIPGKGIHSNGIFTKQ